MEKSEFFSKISPTWQGRTIFEIARELHIFYPECWALVYFFRDYFRVNHEGQVYLKRKVPVQVERPQQQNSQALENTHNNSVSERNDEDELIECFELTEEQKKVARQTLKALGRTTLGDSTPTKDLDSDRRMSVKVSPERKVRYEQSPSAYLIGISKLSQKDTKAQLQRIKRNGNLGPGSKIG